MANDLFESDLKIKEICEVENQKLKESIKQLGQQLKRAKTQYNKNLQVLYAINQKVYRAGVKKKEEEKKEGDGVPVTDESNLVTSPSAPLGRVPDGDL